MVLNVTEVYDFNELYNSSWGGAIDTLKTIEENEKEDEFLQMLNDIIECTTSHSLDRTQLNDYIWFDSDDIYYTLGIDTDEQDV